MTFVLGCVQLLALALRRTMPMIEMSGKRRLYVVHRKDDSISVGAVVGILHGPQKGRTYPPGLLGIASQRRACGAFCNGRAEGSGPSAKNWKLRTKASAMTASSWAISALRECWRASS